MKIKNIVHLADIHIEKSTNRHEEYERVFETLYISLEERKPDRVVLVGDLFDDKLETSNEMYIVATRFIKSLSTLTKKLIITRGNHDLNIKNAKRIDTIETVLSPLDLTNVIYIKESGFYVDENVIWVVHDHLDKVNPWHELNKNHIEKNYLFKGISGLEVTENINKTNLKTFLKKYKTINLFHDPINGSMTPVGQEMNSSRYRNLSDFEGDLLFLGDIHKKQYFNK